MESRRYILKAALVQHKIRRLALQIIETNEGVEEIIIAGITGNGLVLAAMLEKEMTHMGGLATKSISITLNKSHPAEVTLSETLDFNNRVILLVDDVSNSGKTLLYALKPLLDFHPKKIQTLVLVCRSHNNFPIHPDYIGFELATTLQEHIYVEENNGEIIGAYLK